MNDGASMSGFELSMILIGSMVFLVWGCRSIYRKMVARQIGRFFASLCGVASGCVLAFSWFVLVGIAFDLQSLRFMFPVAMIAIGAFYAAWRYTRVPPAIESGAVADSGVPAKSPNSLIKVLTDEYTMIRDSLRDKKTEKTIAGNLGGTKVELLPALYEFNYAKEDGEISSRRVFVQSTGFSGGRQYLEGICKTRNATRTFRVDRVIGPMTRVNDGCVIRAPELFALSTPVPISTFSGPSSSRVSQRKGGWETAVFFAGFGAVKRAELEELAEAAGWQVRYSITKTVDYVVTGSMAGSAQLAKADEMGITVLDEAGFRGEV